MQVNMSKIVVLGTGGTIAGRSDMPSDAVGYRAGVVPIEDLLEPVLQRYGAQHHPANIETQQIAQMDSKDMDDRTWGLLAQRINALFSDPSVVGIVVTHGTDTIEETAHFLNQVLMPTKPVVLTCAMRPSTALLSDGPQNLLDACVVASSADAAGVWVLALGAVHTAEAIQKLHPYRLDALASAEIGPAGFVEEGELRWLTPTLGQPSFRKHSNPGPGLPDRFFEQIVEVGLPRVELLYSHAGAAGDAIDAMVEYRQAASPLRGLVVAGTGNGTVHRQLWPALERARDAGIRVVRCSRCSGGKMVLGSASGLNDWPAVLNLSPYKARISLALSIAIGEFDASY
jgi:L-asparaginase